MKAFFHRLYKAWAILTCILCAPLLVSGAIESTHAAGARLRVSTFDIDVTPPIGSWMAYDPVTNIWEMGLRARGIVLLGAGEPIVLCAIDWIGIANEGHDAFCNALAAAAGTSPK